jgi:hypothetical protein
MQKGKSFVPHGFDALDLYYPTLTAVHRTKLLRVLFPEFVAGGVGKWRVQFDQRNKKARLWAMVSAFEDEASKLRVVDGSDAANSSNRDGGGSDDSDDEQAAFAKIVMAKAKPKIKVANAGTKGAGSLLVLKREGKSTTSRGKSKSAVDASSTASVVSVSPPRGIPKGKRLGPLSSSTLMALEAHIRAYQQHAPFHAILERIEPLPDEAGGGGAGGGMSCLVCSDSFSFADGLLCNSDESMHFLCRSCLNGYITKTLQSGSVSSTRCPDPSCTALFATADARSALSSWDALEIERREEERNRRVAMAAKATLHCVCGVVAIVTEEDMGNGTVSSCSGSAAMCGPAFHLSAYSLVSSSACSQPKSL